VEGAPPVPRETENKVHALIYNRAARAIWVGVPLAFYIVFYLLLMGAFSAFRFWTLPVGLALAGIVFIVEAHLLERKRILEKEIWDALPSGWHLVYSDRRALPGGADIGLLFGEEFEEYLRKKACRVCGPDLHLKR